MWIVNVLIILFLFEKWINSPPCRADRDISRAPYIRSGGFISVHWIERRFRRQKLDCVRIVGFVFEQQVIFGSYLRVHSAAPAQRNLHMILRCCRKIREDWTVANVYQYKYEWLLNAKVCWWQLKPHRRCHSEPLPCARVRVRAWNQPGRTASFLRSCKTSLCGQLSFNHTTPRNKFKTAV